MSPDINSIKPTNPYTIRQVRPKRDHEGKKDYPHQDANGFAAELGDALDDDQQQPKDQDHPPQQPAKPTGQQPAEEPSEQPQEPGGHLDLEA